MIFSQFQWDPIGDGSSDPQGVGSRRCCVFPRGTLVMLWNHEFIFVFIMCMLIALADIIYIYTIIRFMV